MLYYRCKCGDATAWGSMPPDRCDFCPKCNTTLATHPDGHREPTPHDLTSVSTIATDQGSATITRCRYCHLTKAEIEQRDARKTEP